MAAYALALYFTSYEFLFICCCWCSCRDPNARIGRFSWLVFAALICETLFEIKMGWNILVLPLHRYTYIAWGVSGLIFLVWIFWHFTLPFRDMPIIGRYFRTIEHTMKKNKWFFVFVFLCTFTHYKLYLSHSNGCTHNRSHFLTLQLLKSNLGSKHVQKSRHWITR